MLEIELTETAVVSEYDRVKRLLSSFQSDGMQTSLDDFGAGSSLLNNIVDIPVNTIKLDKLFLTRCSSNARGTDFLREGRTSGQTAGLQRHLRRHRDRGAGAAPPLAGLRRRAGFLVLQGHPG